MNFTRLTERETFWRNCSLLNNSAKLKLFWSRCAVLIIVPQSLFLDFFLLSQRKIATPSISFPFFPRGHHSKLEVVNFLKIFLRIMYCKRMIFIPKTCLILRKKYCVFWFFVNKHVINNYILFAKNHIMHSFFLRIRHTVGTEIILLQYIVRKKIFPSFDPWGKNKALFRRCTRK